MLQILKKIFNPSPAISMKDLMAQGAQIIDVRTKQEYESGHIKGSVNIPLQSLAENLPKIRKDKPVITCCASGIRSGSAKRILAMKGFTEVYNGGGWMSLQSKLR